MSRFENGQGQIVYQGPPRWDGKKYVNSGTFKLSGPGHGDEGLSLGPEIEGLYGPGIIRRFDGSVDSPFARLSSTQYEPRVITASLNSFAIDGSYEKPIRRFYQAHSVWDRGDVPGRLWAFRKDINHYPRYLPVFAGEEAFGGSSYKDLNVTRGWRDKPWSWRSESPFFLGMPMTKTFKREGDDLLSLRFYNPSTAPYCYPVLERVQPAGVSTIRINDHRAFQIPEVESGETQRINFNPAEAAVLSRFNTDKPKVKLGHFAATMPNIYLEPESLNEIYITVPKRNARLDERAYRLIIQPLFISWM